VLRVKYAGVVILCLSLWADSLAAQKPAQKQRIERLYAEDADAWSRHDIAKILSFFDPACVFVAPGGKRTSYAEWRQSVPASLARERHSQVRTTVKAVQGVENGFVATVELQDSYEIYDPKRSAWIPMASFSPQEDTWRSDSRGNFKIVLVKFLPGEASPVIAQSGGYQLTEEMIQRALLLAQIEAGADFSPSDAAALRADLIAYFQKEPAKQIEAHKSIAKLLQQAPHGSSWQRALLRDNVWQFYGQNPQAFRDWQSYPFGKMVLKYNPVVVNSGGTIITKVHVDSLYYSNALVAEAAGLAPPAQAEKDQLIRSLPSRFGSLTKEQQEYLSRANGRMWAFATIYSQTKNTRAAMIADIRRNVHSSADIPKEARRVENDCVNDNGKYFQRSLLEGATNVTTMSMGLDAIRRTMRDMHLAPK
jgi:ketosteroid isomerase-like protein